MIHAPRTEKSHTGRSARDVRCPLCGAAPHRSCETADGMPWADHAERIALAAALDDPDGERARRRRQVRYDSPPDMPQVARERRLPREYVRGFSCPKCASGPQEQCVDESGQTRTQNHRDRVAVARASLSKRSAGPVIVRLWVAGTCPGGPGPGGWAAARWVKDRELVLRGNAALTTEHRMILTAVIEGLLALPRTSVRVTVHVHRARPHRPEQRLAGALEGARLDQARRHARQEPRPMGTPGRRD